MNRSLLHFLREALSNLAHPADSKLGKSLWLLFRRPGALTLSYLRGERVPYLHPFRVFLVANVFFFLAASISGNSPLTTRLSTHISAQNFFHRDLARRMVDKHLSTGELEYEAYEEVFDQRVETLSKTLVFLMIPTFALLLGVATFWKRTYAVDHLVFACHTYAHLLLYNFLLATALLAALFYPFPGIRVSDHWEYISSGLSLLVVVWFLFFGLKRVYTTGTWTSLMLSVILGLGIYLVLLLYRAVLFLVTFYALLF